MQYLFKYYCTFGRTGGAGTDEDTIDNVNFAKFARECPNLLDKVLTRTEVDLIFTKAKPKFERRLNFSHFLDALSGMAHKKYASVDPATGFGLLLENHVLVNPCLTVLAGAAAAAAIPSAPVPAPRAFSASPAAPPSADPYVSHEARYSAHMEQVARAQGEARSAAAGYGSPTARPRTASVGSGGSVGSPGVTYAGSANKSGGVYDRLSSKESFTGVYAKRFDGSGGRINAEASFGVSAVPTKYKGNTNTGTEEVIHDISKTLRTNISSTGSRMMKF